MLISVTIHAANLLTGPSSGDFGSCLRERSRSRNLSVNQIFTELFLLHPGGIPVVRNSHLKIKGLQGNIPPPHAPTDSPAQSGMVVWFSAERSSLKQATFPKYCCLN